MSNAFGQRDFGWNGAENNPRETRSGETVLDQTFATGDSCRLAVDNPRGLIHVVGWDRPEVHVVATKLPDSSEARFRATQVQAEQQGNGVFIRTTLDPAAAFAHPDQPQSIAQEVIQAVSDFVQQRKPSPVVYQIQAPRHAMLDLKAVSADVDVKDIDGAVRSHVVSGNAALDQVQGDVSLHSVSGNLAAKDLRGRVEINSVSGDVNLVGRVDALRVNSVSGSVELAGPLDPSGSYTFHSVSGNVTLRVPADARASISIRGVSADVSTELAVQVVEDTRRPGQRAWRGVLGGGGASVSLQTVSGRLRLTRWTAPASSAASTGAGAAGSTTSGPGGLPSNQTTEATPAPPAAEATSSTAPNPSAASGTSETTSAAAGASGAPTNETAGVFGAPTNETSSASAGPTANGGDSMSVLQALERGDLSVDEALKRLAALRGENSP